MGTRAAGNTRLTRVWEILQAVAQRLGDPAVSDAVARAGRKLTGKEFNLVVLGQFKRGKSTLVNALVGEPLLPTAVVPLTSAVTILRSGPKPEMTVHFLDGRQVPAPVQDLPLYVTERENPRNVRGVGAVEIRHPSPLLAEGVRLVDTPGVGSVYEHNTRTTLQFLPDADAAIFVLSVEPPLTAAEREFLDEARQYAGKFLFVLNKIDALSPAETAESLAFTRSVLEEATRQDSVRLFALSARQALEARMAGDADGLERSGLLDLEREIRRLVVADRETVLGESARLALERALLSLTTALTLEQQALRVSAEEIRQRRDRLERYLASARSEAEDLEPLMRSGLARIVQEADGRLRLFRQSLEPDLHERALRRLNATTGGAAELVRDLEKFLAENIPAAFDRWIAEENRRLEAAVRAMARRLSERAAAVVEGFIELAGTLFAVELPPPQPDPNLVDDVRLTYRIGEDEGFLMPRSDRLVALLPRPLALRVLTSGLRRRIAEQVDLNAGRVRENLVERLDQTARQVRSGLDAYLEAAALGIREALTRAERLQEERGPALERRRQEVADDLASLAEARRLLEEGGRAPVERTG
ncbi:dynamin family protein [Caldinitratiruptor microaerophilus]|uniref:Dynamin N-terminal domain-containing protein n=1 Tax=Caldinitratiruptor microaerophilus TaxID=671077 RepID=A0AA35CNC4_9FIRM|nr:dynamin family protein [Caldinitratiruptor microaerophilus]BDG61568.1 hypothetical protein caldi_26580 [Caldinitratiruptor microaerophilus]